MPRTRAGAGARPGLPPTGGRRRSLSEPARPPPRAGDLAGVPDYCHDPRYAEWYYQQRVRPCRYPPPVATVTTSDRVAAARHRRLPGTGQPLALPSRRGSTQSTQSVAASSVTAQSFSSWDASAAVRHDADAGDGGWGHARAADAVPPQWTPQQPPAAAPRPPPLSPVTAYGAAAPPMSAASPATPALISDGTPGPSSAHGSVALTMAPMTVADVPMERLPPSQQMWPAAAPSTPLPPLWRETTKRNLPAFKDKVRLSGISLVASKPVQGDSRETSARFQCGLLEAFASQLGIPYTDVIGAKMHWDFTNQCQADGAVVGLSWPHNVTHAKQMQSFQYDGAIICVEA